MHKLKLTCFCGAILASVAVFAGVGNTCFWTGAGGDGSWQNAANWSVAPVSGHSDTLVFPSPAADLVVSNTVADFSVRNIVVTNAASHTVTFNGERIKLTSDAIGVQAAYCTSACCALSADSDSPVVFNAELLFDQKAQLASNFATYNGKITISGAYRLDILRGETPPTARSVTFNGDIYGPKATLNSGIGLNNNTDGRVTYNGALTLAKLFIGDTNSNVPTYIRSSGNEVAAYAGRYNRGVHFAVANVFTTNLVWDTTCSSQYDGTQYFLTGDQVCNRLQTTTPDASLGTIRTESTGGASTLTLRATQSSACRVNFQYGMSLVYDPTDDFTQTFGGATTSSMTGMIEVKGGTVALADTAKFTALAGITIRKDAKLSVADSTAETPVPTTVPVTIFKGGKIVVPAGKTLQVGLVFYDGKAQPADTYAKDTCDWIEGDGSVTTSVPSDTAWWKSPADGAWSTAANWVPSGVPADGTPKIYIQNYDGATDFAVTADRNDYAFGRLYLGTGDTNAVATLAVTNDAVFRNGSAFTVDAGGRFVQGAGAVIISNEANAISVKAGGRWSVTGGTQKIVYTLAAGTPAISAGASAEVTGGKLHLLNRKGNTSPLQLCGGTFTVSGAGELDAYTGGSLGQWVSGYGEIVVKDDAKWSMMVAGSGTADGRLTYTFRDNACFLTDIVIAGYRKNADVIIDFGSTNAESSISQESMFGVNYNCRCEVVVREGAVAPAMGSIWVGGYYARLGFSYSSNPVAVCPTGIVTVAGLVDTRNTWEDGSAMATGLIVGSTDCTMGLNGATWSRATTWPCGSVTVEPTGILSNHIGYTWIGMGYGEGTLAVHGGRYVRDGSGWVAIGGGEGVGCLSVTGGGIYRVTACDTYVGSFIPSEHGYSWPNYPEDVGTSTGRVDVADGLVDCSSRTLRVGGHGTALLNVGGAGTVKAKDLVLGCDIETAVAFASSAEGSLGTIACTGAVTIAPGTKLTVDLTASGTNFPRTKILTAEGGITGSFAVTVVGVPRARVSQRANCVIVAPYAGFALLLK